ncbi:MAG: ferrochelatase [Deltaproteobacteria bacterium]|nr:ferrochelatase [Deltaproteobacteria bacterium]
MSKRKKAFVLLAFGGADSIESVEPFVRNVLKGRPITPELIEKTKERYKLIGGKSPLLDITRAQAEAIKKLLNKDGLDYGAYVGMRYWHPFIKDTMRRIKDDGVEVLTAIIMSPFTSLIATGAYEKDVEEFLNSSGGPDTAYIDRWHLNAVFLDIIAGNVEKELASFPDRKDALVIFSNHSLPLMSLEGDPYEMLINQSVEEIVKRTEPIDFQVGYQSKGAGPREWLGPSTEDLIEGAKKAGKKGVVIVPLGFLADHVETLYDIDILFKGMADSHGLAFRRTPSLNTSPGLMELLAGLIKKSGEKR